MPGRQLPPAGPLTAKRARRGVEPRKGADLPWTPADLAQMRRALLAHYDTHAREMPWRGERDPYRIWISEVMLQQTRVETVRARYAPFLAAFPDVASLATAGEHAVLKAWEGLGYYGRARNLRRAAAAIVAEHGGRLPEAGEALAALPGFGPYTSAAVSSIAFGARAAVLDGNVVRVLARLLDERRDVGEARVRARLAAAADALVDPGRPGDWNQAIMDLGATVCVPRAPRCLLCPFLRRCAGRAAGVAETLPVKARKAKGPHKEIAAAVVWKGGRVLIGRRPAEGLLGGLYELPGGKREPGETLERACAREVLEETGLRVEVRDRLATVDHAYSHFSITLTVFHARWLGGRLRARGVEDLRFVSLHELDRYAFPRANLRILAVLRATGAPSWAAAPVPASRRNRPSRG